MHSVDVTLHLPAGMRLPVPDAVDADAVRREELLSWQVHGADGVVAFLSLVHGDPAVARQALNALDAVEFGDVTPVDDDRCYVYVEMAVREAEQPLWAALGAERLVVVPPVVYDDAATVHLTVLGEDDALAGFLDALPGSVDASVDRLSEHRHATGALSGRLTARQFEAVETARDLGYYDVPRSGSLAAVANELDVSESAASTLLRKAERALVDALLRT